VNKPAHVRSVTPGVVGWEGGNMALSTRENIPCTGHNSAKKIWKPAFSRKNERENDETA